MNSKNKYQTTQSFRLQMIKDKEVKYETGIISHSDVAASLITNTIIEAGYTDREQMVAIFVNAKNRVIGSSIISVGGITSCNVFPQDIVKTALTCNATAIILGHNHPSGVMEPSPDDKRITQKILLAAMMLGITVHEHLIVDIHQKGYFSMADHGYMVGYKQEAEKILNNNFH